MTPYVVDASVAAMWVLREPLSEPARAILRPTARLHAPDFLLLELDSVLAKWLRRGEISRAEAEEARAVIRRAPLELASFVSFQAQAWQLACQTGCSIYDCLYLAMAVALGAPLVTADRKFLRTFERGPLARHVLWVEDATAQTEV